MEENLEMQDLKKEDTVIVSAERKEPWGEKRVTRKVLTIALAAAVFLNAVLTAGVMALFARHNAHNRPDMYGMGRPGSEMFSDRPGNGGRMAPPGNPWVNRNGGQGNQNAVPGQQNGTPDQQNNAQDSQNNAQDQQNDSQG